MAARIAIIAMTTSNSISVKPSRNEGFAGFLAGEPLVKPSNLPSCCRVNSSNKKSVVVCRQGCGFTRFLMYYSYFSRETIMSEGEGQTRFLMPPPSSRRGKFIWRNSVAAYNWQPRGSASRLIREQSWPVFDKTHRKSNEDWNSKSRALQSWRIAIEKVPLKKLKTALD